MRNVRRVAIVGPLVDLSVCPSVTSSLRMWIRNNYFVDYIAIKAMAEYKRFLPFFKDEKMCVYIIPMRIRKINVPILGGMINILGLIISSFRHCKGKRYECFIGFDPLGLTVATALGRLSNTPVIYHSLELTFSSDAKTLSEKLYKMLERWCNKRAAYTITQDEARAKCLIEDNNIINEKILIVPNTYLQEGKIVRNRYLREILDISEDKKIILHVGGLIWYNMVPELISSVPTWPENCVLVLHGWVRRGTEKGDYLGYLGYLRELTEGSGLYNKRIFFSTDVLPQEDLDKMVSSADIGIALYHNVNLNFYNMASGKLFQYLKCSLPVITIDFPSLKKVVEDNCCGICINDKNEIAEAIRKILSNYETFSSNARKCFEEKYEFSRFYQNVIEKVSNLRTQ